MTTPKQIEKVNTLLGGKPPSFIPGKTIQSAVPRDRVFTGVTVPLKANVYFDGKVVSHTLLLEDGAKKTVGLIYPGTFTFNTGDPELMEILAGTCDVKLAGEKEWRPYTEGTAFRVPGKSSFDIRVTAGIAEYLCSFGE